MLSTMANIRQTKSYTTEH